MFPLMLPVLNRDYQPQSSKNSYLPKGLTIRIWANLRHGPLNVAPLPFFQKVLKPLSPRVVQRQVPTKHPCHKPQTF